MPEQQQEAGSRKVLQFPGPQEAASYRSHPDRALQRHHRHRWTTIPPYLDIWGVRGVKQKTLLAKAFFFLNPRGKGFWMFANDFTLFLVESCSLHLVQTKECSHLHV